MKKIISVLYIFLLILIFHGADGSCGLNKISNGWKAGVARAIITPGQPIWMAGFTSRTHPATGKLTELWAKALALEDESGKQVLLVTMDLEEIP
jgi:hypothetical protein